MQRNWYDWLKEQIESRNFIRTTECSYMHGQVAFAYISELITEEQKEELVNLIPEY